MMRELFYLLTIIAIWVCPLQGMSDTIPESQGKVPFVRIFYDYGNILKQHQTFLESVNAEGQPFKNFMGFAAEFGYQMWSGKDWYLECNRPRMGVGVKYMRVINRSELGQPIMAYGFLDGILLRTRAFTLTTRYAFGLGYSNRKYEPNEFPVNNILSTHFNVYAELGAGMEIKLSEDIFLDPVFRLSHLSNGNIKEPQKGLNVVSWSVGLRKSFQPLRKTDFSHSNHPLVRRHEILGYVSLCPRQMEFYDPVTKDFIGTYGKNYIMANLHLGYNYELTRRLKLSTGVDLIYDGTNGQLQLAMTGIPDKGAIPFGDKVKVAVFAGWESILSNLSIIGNFGYVVAEKKYYGTFPAFQQRLGFKYHFYKNVFAGMTVRAHNFRIAETLEFNVGMRKYIGSHE